MFMHSRKPSCISIGRVYVIYFLKWRYNLAGFMVEIAIVELQLAGCNAANFCRISLGEGFFYGALSLSLFRVA